MRGFREEDPLTRFLDSAKIFSFLNSKYLAYLHKEIGYLVKNGGFDYYDIMIMPTYSRKIFITQLLPKSE